jgi:small subunit ribosomal protein S27Ae
MPTSFGGSEREKKGKKPYINKPTSKKYSAFKINGAALTKPRSCPRCGPGILLATHKDRLYCGKCHYTEFTVKNNSL